MLARVCIRISEGSLVGEMEFVAMIVNVSVERCNRCVRQRSIE